VLEDMGAQSSPYVFMDSFHHDDGDISIYLSVSIYIYQYLREIWVLNHRPMCAWAVVITMTAAAGGTKTVTLSRRAYGT